jgi:hypothetical protein
VVAQLAPALLSICGCATLAAAKILGETADVRRFRSRRAFARHDGTAPLPVWSSNQPRHRLSRTGNRQINAAIHRIAITQAHWHEPARQLLDRHQHSGKNTAEAIRILKRRLSDVVYQTLLRDAQSGRPDPARRGLIDIGARGRHLWGSASSARLCSDAGRHLCENRLLGYRCAMKIAQPSALCLVLATVIAITMRWVTAFE